MDIEVKGCQWNFLSNSLCLYLQALAQPITVYTFLIQAFSGHLWRKWNWKRSKILNSNKTYKCSHTVISFKHLQTFNHLAKDLRT